MEVGILAVQGDFAEHQQMLARMGVASRLVRNASELAELPALIFPGGESTTMLKILTEEQWTEPLTRWVARGGAIYGTCAGAILMAQKVSDPAQPSYGFLPITVQRNAYGRQVASHVSREACRALGDVPVEMVFIRAPVIREIGETVEVLGQHRGHPVFVRQGRMMATTFHPELTRDDRVHRYFLERVAELEL